MALSEPLRAPALDVLLKSGLLGNATVDQVRALADDVTSAVTWFLRQRFENSVAVAHANPEAEPLSALDKVADRVVRAGRERSDPHLSGDIAHVVVSAFDLRSRD